MLDTLKLINSKTVNTHVALGSLVRTTSNNYYISISVGKIEIDNEIYFGISLLSPIGQLLKNKTVGESIIFNNTTITITEII